MTIGAPQSLLAVSVSPARRDLLYTSAARCSTQGHPTFTYRWQQWFRFEEVCHHVTCRNVVIMGKIWTRC